jgi:hypothetical protein
MSLAFSAQSCTAAWKPGVPGRFDLEPPEGFSVERNYRWFGNDFVVLARGKEAIEVARYKEDARSRRVPLDLVVEARALDWGRRFGVGSGQDGLHEIMVDGRQAWAVSGRRKWRWVEMGYTTVALRGGSHLVMLTGMAPAPEFESFVPSWSTMLEAFTLGEGLADERLP